MSGVWRLGERIINAVIDEAAVQIGNTMAESFLSRMEA